jgi:hypothetical protein
MEQGQYLYTSLSAETYITQVVAKFETTLETTFAHKKTPMDAGYHPESDETSFLDPREASLYRGLIDSANWMITLGRFDISYATNTLARYSMAPRTGHFQAIIRVFGYLKSQPKFQILVDPKPHERQNTTTTRHEWTEFYPDATEEIPHDAPRPLGAVASTVCYVDADHAHDVVTRRSVSGVLLFVNSIPIKWYSKRQATVETTYGSELVASPISVELILELRYKLRMLGIPMDGPTLLLGDNMSVVLNTTIPSSQLKKKHNAIAYHRVREAIAGDIIRYAHIPSTENAADCLTKPLPTDQFCRVVHPILNRRPPVSRPRR